MTENKPDFCEFCKASRIVRIGKIPTVTGKKQRFQCRECGRTFYGTNN